ncbi:MAG: MOSC domain-containing protein [Verrucomicrobiales bacterium]|nr:MOSC domain-containing protein [Verrucomicrobiales bacterium]
MIVRHLYISPDHNYFGHHGKPAGQSPALPVESVELVAGKGIVGDRFFGYKEDYKGQVTFFSLETYKRLCDTFDVDDKDPSTFRRNIIVEGADLPALIGQQLQVGEITFLGTCESSPCYWMDQAFHPGAEDALRGHGGLRAKVLTSGTLKIGDTSPS